MVMVVAIQMLDKSLCKVRNVRNNFQLNTVRQFWEGVSYVYYATYTADESRYSLKSHQGIVLQMYEGDMLLELMEKFVTVMKRRMPEDSSCNKPVNSLVVNYILNHIEH